MKFSSEKQSAGNQRNERQKIEFRGLREEWAKGRSRELREEKKCGRSEGVERGEK